MAKETEDKVEKPEELIPVGDGADPVEENSSEESPEASLDDGDSDDRVGHEENEEDGDRQAIRERRREERKRRRNRDRVELNYLRNRNDDLEKQISTIAQRQTQHERLTVEQRLSQLDDKIAEVDSIYDKAIINKDEATAGEARRVKRHLEGAKEKLSGSAAAPLEEESEDRRSEARPTSPPRIDPRKLERAQSWASKNDWFDPHLRDERSQIVKVMEDNLQREGEYRADEREYWQELDRRIARRFPELRKANRADPSERDIFGEEDDDEEDERPSQKPPEKRRSKGPQFSVGGRTRSLKPNEVYLDKARREALEAAGAWDDPVLRARYMKSYQRFDAEEAQKNRTR